MNNKVITSQGNVQFIFPDGKIVNVHPNHIYTVFNEDTVSFILVALPKSSGLALMTSKAEDLELNGETYSFAELPAAMSEAFAIAGAQARCEIVDELPESGYTNTIYLVPQPAPQTGFDEYVYVDTGWELIGDTSIEMANYVTKAVFSGYTASTAAELSGKAEVVEITQANYDLLPSSAKTDASKLYVISDALPIDLSIYAKASALTAEESARIAADSALTNAITAEENRAKAAESGLSDTIVAEIARAEEAESGLSNAITGETSAREAADSAISGVVDTKLATSVFEAYSASTEADINAISGVVDTKLAINDFNAYSGNVDSAMALKLDASAYTVDSSVIENSVNPVQGGALYDELRIEGEPSETTLEWDNHDGGETTNYPNGVSTIKIEVVDGSEGGGNGYNFFDENYEQLGYITVLYNDGDVTVDSYENVTYSISSNVVTVNYPTIAANVTIIGSNYNNVYTIKAIGESSVISVKDQVSANTAAIDTKQPLLQAGENITISGNVISAEGGGKAIEGGRGISVTTGETADTVSFDLPIYIGSMSTSVRENYTGNTASNYYAHAEGMNTTASGDKSHAEGYYTTASGMFSHTEGWDSQATNSGAHAEGKAAIASGSYSHAEGYYTKTNNQSEHASGEYNVSNTGASTSAQTLFSVGNGTGNGARHNAFEIRKNGDIYIQSGNTDILLQDYLGGGGSITVDSALDTGSTNPVANSAITTSLNDKANKSAAYGSYQFGSTGDKPWIRYRSVSNDNLGNEIYYAKINNKGILTTNGTWAGNNLDLSLVETSAITTSVTSASTDSQVPSAKAVYDALGGGGSITVDSALDSGSTNPVQNQALYSELRLSDGGETETTLTFEGHYSTNYPEGCTKLKVEVAGSNSHSTISFWNDWNNLGFIDVGNYGSISVDTNGFQGAATYEISGNTVIISYPTVTNVTKIQVDGEGNYVFKAVTTEPPTALKTQVAANTTALGGLKLQQISQSDYDNLPTKDSSTLYIII